MAFNLFEMLDALTKREKCELKEATAGNCHQEAETVKRSERPCSPKKYYPPEKGGDHDPQKNNVVGF